MLWFPREKRDVQIVVFNEIKRKESYSFNYDIIKRLGLKSKSFFHYLSSVRDRLYYYLGLKDNLPLENCPQTITHGQSDLGQFPPYLYPPPNPPPQDSFGLSTFSGIAFNQKC